MKSLERMPTKDNLLSTLLKDQIGRSEDVMRFTEVLNCIEGCFSIAIDGQWGSGKTFFVKQVKMILDAYNSAMECSLSDNEKAHIKNYISTNAKELSDLLNRTPQICVYYDAWANDNDVDPILSIVYEIATSIKSKASLVHRDYIEIISSILDFFSDKSTERIRDAINGTSLTDSVKQQRNIYDEVNRFFDSIIIAENNYSQTKENTGHRLVLIIDELDRCRPSFTVRLLERIKHYFAHENVTFVFSINSLSLQHTIKKYYGSDFDATRYMDRFFDISMSLPPIDYNSFVDLIGARSRNKMFEKNRIRIISKYHFSMREIMRYYKLTNTAANKLDFNLANNRDLSTWALYFSLTFLLPIAAGLKMRDVEEYNEFITGNNFNCLSEFADDESIDICECLLLKNEKYKPVDSCITVRLEDKLQAVYYAVFRERYENNQKIKIGRAEFSRDTKVSFMRALSVMSEYSDYS